MKIRNKILFWLLPSVIVIGIATVATLYHFISKTVRQNIFDQLEIASDELLVHIDLFLDGKKNRLIDFSSDGFIRDSTEKITNGIDVDSCTLKLNRHLLYNKQPLDTGIVEIFIVDLEGKVISSTEINRVGKDVSGEPYFSKTMKRGSHINDLHYYSEFRLNIFEVSKLLTSKDGMNVIGIIVNSYKGDSLRKVTRSGMTGELGGAERLKGLGETGELYIVNSDKLMITGSRFIKGSILKQVVDTEGVRAAFDNKRGMIGVYPDYRGIPVLGVSRYYEEMDWVVLSEKDVSEAFAPIARLRNISIIIEIISITIIVIIAVVFAAGITRPIKSLVGFVNRIAKGDLTGQIKVKTKDEIGDLANSFESMRTKLSELIKDTEKGVRDWESTFDSVRDIIILWDKDCRLIRCNKALLNKLNVKPEDIIGKNCSEIFPKIKEEDLSKCAVIETTETLKPVTSEMEIPCLNGFFSISSFPRFDANGEFAGAVQIMKDITERKKAEDELRNHRDHLEALVEERTREIQISEERLRESNELKKRIIESSVDCIKRLDLQGNLLFMSKGGQEALEIDDLESLLNKSWINYWKGSDHKAASAAISKAKNGSIGTFQGFCRTMKGNPKWWDVIISPIYSSDGKVEQLLSISRDITKSKMYEEKLVEAKSKAEVANLAKSEFLANMSHELKTPLNSVIGFSEILIDKSFGEINEKQEKYLNNIYKSGKHLLEMINDIIDLSKAEVGRMELELKEFSLPQILNDSVAAMKPATIKKNIEIKTHMDKELSTINADEVKLRKIIKMLLDNAVKFTPDGGMIKIEAKMISDFRFGISDLKDDPVSKNRNPECLEISITDTGIGVKPEEKEQIFEGFKQIDGSYTREHGGTGLGLALAKRFVEMHGGKIWAESPPKKDMALEEGKGSSFIFTIPMKP